MDDLTSTLATMVRRHRSKAGWTQEELADRVGLSVRYIGEIERRQASPTVSVLGRLANAFGIDPAELLKPVRRQKPSRT